jgi:ATP-dependent RNA helicase DeaD
MGITREDVGNIKLRENSATIELSERAAGLLESKKGRMAKEGISVSAVRALTSDSKESAYGRTLHRGRTENRTAETRSPERRDRYARGRKTDFERVPARRA